MVDSRSLMNGRHLDACITSRYWFFETPITPLWVGNESRRLVIEKAAKGESLLNDECLNVLRKVVRGLNAWFS